MGDTHTNALSHAPNRPHPYRHRSTNRSAPWDPTPAGRLLLPRRQSRCRKAPYPTAPPNPRSLAPHALGPQVSRHPLGAAAVGFVQPLCTERLSRLGCAQPLYHLAWDFLAAVRASVRAMRKIHLFSTTHSTLSPFSISRA